MDRAGQGGGRTTNTGQEQERRGGDAVRLFLLLCGKMRKRRSEILRELERCSGLL